MTYITVGKDLLTLICVIQFWNEDDENHVLNEGDEEVW